MTEIDGGNPVLRDLRPSDQLDEVRTDEVEVGDVLFKAFEGPECLSWSHCPHDRQGSLPLQHREELGPIDEFLEQGMVVRVEFYFRF